MRKQTGSIADCSTVMAILLCAVAAGPLGCGPVDPDLGEIGNDAALFAAGSSKSTLRRKCKRMKARCARNPKACEIKEAFCGWTEREDKDGNTVLAWSLELSCAHQYRTCKTTSHESADRACTLHTIFCAAFEDDVLVALLAPESPEIVPLAAADPAPTHADVVTPMDSPTDQHLYGVSGAGTRSVFAVGAGGTIVHYDGMDWELMSSGTTIRLTAVWARNPYDAYAVGGNVVLHYDGNSWSQIEVDLDDPLRNAKSVWNTDSHVYVAEEYSAFRGRLLRYDPGAPAGEKKWTDITPEPSQRLSAVWLGGAGGTGWAAGLTTDLSGGSSNPSHVLHFSGDQWTALEPPEAATIPGSDKKAYLFGLAGAYFRPDVYAVGAYSTVLHHDGTSWARLALPDAGKTWHLYGVAHVEPNFSIPALTVAVGRTVRHDTLQPDDSNILAYDGQSWSVVQSGTAQSLNAVYAHNAENVFIVGGNGAILHHSRSTDDGGPRTCMFNMSPIGETERCIQLDYEDVVTYMEECGGSIGSISDDDVCQNNCLEGGAGCDSAVTTCYSAPTSAMTDIPLWQFCPHGCAQGQCY